MSSRRVLCGVAGLALLTGCFTTAADFRSDAETFILEDEGLAEAVETSFTAATCQAPVNQDVGTTFTCDATDVDGRAWEFEIVITDSNEYEVNVSRFPADL